MPGYRKHREQYLSRKGRQVSAQSCPVNIVRGPDRQVLYVPIDQDQVQQLTMEKRKC